MAQLMESLVGTPGNALERVESSRKLNQILTRSLKGLGLAALWGVAAGAASPALAVANIYKVPMVLALSALVSLPAILVSRHLLRITVAPLDICSALVTSLYRAALLLAGIAPLLGVYAYTSRWFAPVLAQGSALLSLLVVAFSLRHELSRIEGPRAELIWLGLITCAVLGLSLLQLVSLATPVLTVPTLFGHGIDGVVR